MFKLIIYVTGKPSLHGYKRREFTWSAVHNCHVFQNKEYAPEEFNAVAEKVLRDNQDMHPLVRAVEIAPTPITQPAAPPEQIAV